MATVRVVVHGRGCVHSWPSGPSVCSTERTLTFRMGDPYDFRASPDEGWNFDRFCNGETPPFCIAEWVLAGKIDAEYGEVHAYFVTSAERLVDQERQERVAADQGLSDRIGSLDRWASERIMEVLASIQDVVARAEQEATAWRRALDDFKAGLYAWLVDRVLGVILSALDRAADARVRQDYHIVPEGPDWSQGTPGTAENITAFPFDPDAVRQASERIAEMRNQAWKSKKGMM